MQASGFQLNALDPRSVGDLQRLAREDPNSPETLRAVSKQFEAMFLQMALKAMRDATPKDSLFDSEHTRTYQGLLDQQLALQMAHTRNNGLSEALFRQLGGLNASLQVKEAAEPALAQSPQRTPAAKDAATNAAMNASTPLIALDESRLSAAEAAANASDDPIGTLIQHIESATSVREVRGWQGLQGVVFNGSGPRVRAAAEAGGTSSAGRRAEAADGIADSGNWTAEDREQFVRELWPHAQAVSRETGIPARFIIAQAALETGWGEKVLRHADGRSSHNYFNIKAGSQWQGETIARTVKEYRGASPYQETAEFRSYASLGEAVRDYARLLTDNPRYERVLGQTDAVAFARNLHKAGYATDPRYAEKLTSVIRSRTLSNALSA